MLGDRKFQSKVDEPALLYYALKNYTTINGFSLAIPTGAWIFLINHFHAISKISGLTLANLIEKNK